MSSAPPEDTDLELGSIVTSHSHMDYVAEVFTERAREHPPDREDYTFGQPVYVETTIDGDDHAVVGVIYDTQLVNPDQGQAGPRLAPDRQEMFTPGYVEEKQTLIGIALLGYAALADSDGPARLTSPRHEMPPWTLSVDDIVYRLSPEGIRTFHRVDGDLRLGYYQRLLDVAGPFGAEVTVALVQQLQALTEDSTPVLDVIEKNVKWQANADRGVVR